MKGCVRIDSIATTKYSLTGATVKKPARQHTISILEFSFSPQSRASPQAVAIKTGFGRSKRARESLEFRSTHKRKKIYKFAVFEEEDRLRMGRRMAGLLVDTPEEDFDCSSDEDRIKEVVQRKFRELKYELERSED